MGITVKNGLNLGGLLSGHVTREALQDGADHIGQVAQSKAPLLTGEEPLHRANKERRADPGELRESMYVRVLDDGTAEIGFSSFYAGWQHERMDYHHEDGHAKFLEDPLTTEKDETLSIMAERMRQGMDE